MLHMEQQSFVTKASVSCNGRAKQKLNSQRTVSRNDSQITSKVSIYKIHKGARGLGPPCDQLAN
jgi:hypothetical protein